MAKTVISTSVDIDVNDTSSDPISPDIFGANFIVGKDSFSGTYGEKVLELGATVIRFPGGGVSESSFDLSDPDNLPENMYGDVETLSNFLSFCAENGIKPVIVIPTKIWKYLGIEEGVEQVSEFIDRLTSGEFGDTSGLTIEIGNEYWNDFEDNITGTGGDTKLPGLSAAEYGEIASALIEAIEHSAREPVDIAIQTGKTAADNIEIIDAIESAGLGSSIDTLVYHDYFWTEESIEARNEARAEILEAWSAAGIESDVYVSEWNVGSSPDESTDGDHDYGLAQISAMIEFIHEAAKSGIDMASVWAVQQSNKTSLFYREGTGSDVFRFGGMIFDFMSDHLIGARTLDLPVEETANGEATLHAFENSDEVVVFISANDFDDLNSILSFVLDFGGQGLDLAAAIAYSITSSHDDPESPKGHAVLEEYLLTLDDEAPGTLSIQIDEDYETIMIVIPKVETDPRSMYLTDSGGDDIMVGGAFDDTLIGGNGDDDISSGFGDDTIYGGNDNDTITIQGGNNIVYAGDGNDTVVAFTGNNRIYGGAGDDIIKGGIHSDVISGGTGDDVISGDPLGSVFGSSDIIIGGKGNDLLSGGAGADHFVFFPDDGYDIIGEFEETGDGVFVVTGRDFEIGLDLIDLSHFGDLSSSNIFDFLETTADGVLFSFGGTSFLLYDVDITEITVDDFIFA